jgi:DNA-binding transcriptional LysR family regulator/DNA-binding winged helix-turn-helix (wHTH) protein
MEQFIHRVLRFDRFALDLARGCLRAGDREIHLRPKTFKVLCYLAEHAGRLVSKRELFEGVWSNVAVSDDSLVQCIRELRRKLGDDDHRLIKTVSRRGYLLDATVSAQAPQSTSKSAMQIAELRPTRVAEPDLWRRVPRGTQLATISRKLFDLLEHLKTPFLNRTGRQLTLTDAGRSDVEACKRLLKEADEAERAGANSAPKGHLIITAPVVFGRRHVLPIITSFLKADGDINVRLVLADRIVNLPEDHVDLAVRIGPLSDNGLIATRVGTVRLVLCGSPAYFARRGTPKRPAELGAHDCITVEGVMAAESWRFSVGESSASVAIHPRLVVNTAEAAIDAAIAGLGVTRVLSYQVDDAMRAGALAVVLQDFEPTPWPVRMVYAGGQLLPIKLHAFIDFAAPRLKARLSQMQRRS